MEGVNLPSGALARVGIDFDSSLSGARRGPFDAAFLEQEILMVAGFGISRNVPLHVGEWGPFRACFDSAGKGGLDYVRDLAGILFKHNLNFSFYSYPGMVSDYDGQPDTNAVLISQWTALFQAQPCGTGAGVQSARVFYPVRLSLKPLLHPFRGRLQFALTVPGQEPLILKIFDARGRRIYREILTPGAGEHVFSPRAVLRSPGLYGVAVSQGRQSAFKKVVVFP
jgi:hypothetical protein